MQERTLFGALTVYRERGAYLRRLEQFDKAKASYDEAFKNFPEDVRMLIGRSEVCSDDIQPIQAYSDAQLALKLDQSNMKARYVQARALYTMSDFEESVVMNSRGTRVRRQPPYFVEGLNQGIETMQDCIGVNAGNVMLDFLPLIRKSEVALTDENEPKKSLHISRIPQPVKKKKLTQMQARKHAVLARVLAMKYLGPMANDKFFIQKLTEDERLISANSNGSIELKKIVNESLRSLTKRQEMLRAQKPYYSIKLAEKSESKYQDEYKKNVLIKEREVAAQTVERSLRQIEKSLKAKRVMDVMKYAERLQMFLDLKTPRTLPAKDIYIDRLYRAVGEAYLCQHRVSYTLSERSNRRRIAFLMGLPVGRQKSFDSVLGNYPYKFIDIKKAMSKVLEILEMCENSTMRCWLMYEFARLLTSQKNYALAKYYAKLCQSQAQQISNATWWLNALFVLMSGDMQQCNPNEVRVQVEEAYEYSKMLQDPEEVQAFLGKCAEIMADHVSADDQKVIEQRKKQILNIMEPTQRVETQVLFKKMSILPRGRRFPLLPQGGNFVSQKAERQRRHQPGLTVMPGPPCTLPPPPKSDTLGFQIFDI